MGVSKDQLGSRDVFVDYDYEDVMFRYEAATRRFFRRFYGKPDEEQVQHDNELLNSALRFGEETDAKTYQTGKPRG